MRISSSIIIFLCLLQLVSCRDVPTFTPDNDADPGSSNYTLSGIKQPSFKIEDHETVEIKWNYDGATFYDGFEIYRSLGDTSDFQKIYEGEEKSYIDTPPRHSTNIYYRINAFLLQEDQKAISQYSFLQIEQEFHYPRADLISYDSSFASVTWQQDYRLNSEVKVYRSVNDGSYKYLGSTSVFNEFFNDYNFPNSTQVMYKLEIGNEHYTDSLIIDRIDYYKDEHFGFELSGSSSNSVDLSWDDTSYPEALKISYHENNTAYLETFELEANRTDGSVTLNDLNPNYLYSISVLSVEGTIYTQYSFQELSRQDTLYLENSVRLSSKHEATNSDIQISPDEKYIGIAMFGSFTDAGQVLHTSDLSSYMITESTSYSEFRLNFFERNDTTFMLMGGNQTSLKVWDVTNNKLFDTIPNWYRYNGETTYPNLVWNFALTQNNSKVIVNSYQQVQNKEGSINIYDLEKKDYIKDYRGNFSLLKGVDDFYIGIDVGATNDQFVIFQGGEFKLYSASQNDLGRPLVQLPGFEPYIVKRIYPGFPAQNEFFVLEYGYGNLRKYNFYQDYSEMLYESNDRFLINFSVNESRSLGCIAESKSEEIGYVSCFQNMNFNNPIMQLEYDELPNVAVSPSGEMVIVMVDATIEKYMIENDWKLSN